MSTARRCVYALLFALLALAPGICAAQTAPSSPPQPAQAQPTPPQPKSEQAYNLPPDKLAQAITLNKIRLALEIVGTLWGLAVLWLLLATRAAAGLGAWTQRVVSQRWIQGLLFFGAFFLVTTLASLPLDAIGHTVSRHYGISVQGWASWFGDQGKGLAITLVFGSLILLLFNMIVRVSPRRYWVWL